MKAGGLTCKDGKWHVVATTNYRAHLAETMTSAACFYGEGHETPYVEEASPQQTWLQDAIAMVASTMGPPPSSEEAYPDPSGHEANMAYVGQKRLMTDEHANGVAPPIKQVRVEGGEHAMMAQLRERAAAMDAHQ